MRGWRIALKGLSDTLEHLLSFIIASVSWWCSLCTIVLAPTATRSLFRAADPRIISELERPSVWENARHPIATRGQTWRLALVTLVPIVVLASNLAYYSTSSGVIRLLVPLWLMLLVLFILVAAVAWSAASLLDQPAGAALRLAATITLGRPRKMLQTLLVAAPTLTVLSIMVVPLVLFVPAAAAAIVNRFMLDGLGIEPYDPLAPTDERLTEERQAAASARFGP